MEETRVLPSLSDSQESFLPVSTVQLTYPDVLNISPSMPFKPKTKVAWTEKERKKAMKAPKIATLEALKEEV
jgi:hypothetical protein